MPRVGPVRFWSARRAVDRIHFPVCPRIPPDLAAIFGRHGATRQNRPTQTPESSARFHARSGESPRIPRFVPTESPKTPAQGAGRPGRWVISGKLTPRCSAISFPGTLCFTGFFALAEKIALSRKNLLRVPTENPRYPLTGGDEVSVTTKTAAAAVKNIETSSGGRAQQDQGRIGCFCLWLFEIDGI